MAPGEGGGAAGRGGAGAGPRLGPESAHAVAGLGAGALASVLVAPLDLLKTRLQVQRRGHAKYSRGIPSSLWLIAREEGFRGLYKGLGPTLLVLPPNWAIYFSSYDRLRRAMGYAGGVPSGSGAADTPVPFGVNMLAAGGAGAITAVATNPFWVVKARLQIQDMGIVVGRHFKVPYRNTFNALRRIALEEGLRGLYCGLTPALLGTTHVLIQFPAYEAMKERLARDAGTRVSELNALQLSVASMAGKLAASTCTYPHEVVRSRMQIAGQTAGIAEHVRAILREDGPRGFYRGFFVNLVRTLPTAAITFTTYELIARHLQAPVEGSPAALPPGKAGEG